MNSNFKDTYFKFFYSGNTYSFPAGGLLPKKDCATEEGGNRSSCIRVFPKLILD